MHAMNLRECGTSEMDGKVLILNEGMGSDIDRLSENVFKRLALYYILTKSFPVKNIWYASVGTVAFSDNLLKTEYRI